MTAITNTSNSRTAGILLIAGSILMIFAMLHHPTGHEHEFSEFIEEVQAFQLLNALVHGGAIGLLLIFVLGFSFLSDRLGWNRLDVRLAVIFYVLGGAAMVVAAMISGFIVPFFLDRYSEASAAELQFAESMLTLLREVNRAFDQLGVIGMSVGVFFWSTAMIYRERQKWIGGGLGIAVGVLGVAGVFTGHLEASVPGIISFVLLHGTWNFCIGLKLLRPAAEKS